MKTPSRIWVIAAVAMVSSLCRGQSDPVLVGPPERPTCTTVFHTCPNSYKQTVSGNGRLVAVGRDGKLHRSTDGIEWQPVSMPVDDFIRGISFGAGKFVAVGGSYAPSSSIVLTSSDGRRWTVERCPTKQVLHSIAYGNGQFIAVGANGVILSLRNGCRWQTANSATNATLAAVAFGNGLFLAGGDDGLLFTSREGLHWTPQKSGTRLYISRIIFEGDRFYAGSTVVRLMSSDGVAWTPLQIRETVATTDLSASKTLVPRF
jgi:hypothetical protein